MTAPTDEEIAREMGSAIDDPDDEIYATNVRRASDVARRLIDSAVKARDELIRHLYAEAKHVEHTQEGQVVSFHVEWPNDVEAIALLDEILNGED